MSNVKVLPTNPFELNIKRAINDLALVYADMERAFGALHMDSLHAMSDAYSAYDRLDEQLRRLLTNS